LIIKKIDVNEVFFHDTKTSVYRDGKKHKQIFRKHERNCKTKRQKIMENKYKKSEKDRETTPTRIFEKKD
jgi:hypothetical protein